MKRRKKSGKDKFWSGWMEAKWNTFLKDVLEKASIEDVKEEDISSLSGHTFFRVEKNPSHNMTYFVKALSPQPGSFLSSLFHQIT